MKPTRLWVFISTFIVTIAAMPALPTAASAA